MSRSDRRFAWRVGRGVVSVEEAERRDKLRKLRNKLKAVKRGAR